MTGRNKLQLRAEALIKYETIDSDQIDEIMSGKPPTPPADWIDDSEEPTAGTGVEAEAGGEGPKDDTKGSIGGPAGQH